MIRNCGCKNGSVSAKFKYNKSQSFFYIGLPPLYAQSSISGIYLVDKYKCRSEEKHQIDTMSNTYEVNFFVLIFLYRNKNDVSETALYF